MLGFEPLDFELRQFAHIGIGLVQHGSAPARVGRRLLVFAVLRDDFGQIAVRLGDFAILLAVADDGGIGHLRGQFFEMLFDLVELCGIAYLQTTIRR